MAVCKPLLRAGRGGNEAKLWGWDKTRQLFAEDEKFLFTENPCLGFVALTEECMNFPLYKTVRLGCHSVNLLTRNMKTAVSVCSTVNENNVLKCN